MSFIDTIIASANENDFLAELQAWLDDNVPAEWRTPPFRLPPKPKERIPLLREWQAKMAEGRWTGIHWPIEFGGRAATPGQQIVYNAELAARSLPPLPGHRGLSIVGPTLIRYGTDDQKARFLERIRVGEDLWAGGFSEPDAGSDLASLRTRGVIDGDEIVINGQKIWTSSAHWCNWIF